MTADVNYRALFAHLPGNFLVLAPDPPHFTVLDASDAYLRAVTARREEIIGRPLLDVSPRPFPGGGSTAHRDLEASLCEVVHSRRPHRTALERHGVRGESGQFEERYWERHHAPVFDDHGELICIIQSVDDVTERERAAGALHAREERQRFFSQVSELLASSIEYEATLRLAARLAVPTLADLCVIDVLEEGGTFRRVAFAHVNGLGPEELARAVERCPPKLSREEHPVVRAIRTGEPEIVSLEEAMQRVTESPEHLEILKRISPASLLVTPMISRGHTLGVIQLVSMAHGSARTYGARERTLAEELGHRAAAAIENARLYEAAREARRVAEQRAREDAVFRELARALAGAFGLYRVAALIAQAAVDTTAASSAYIERIESAEGDVEVIATSGAEAPEIGTRVPYPGSLSEEIIERGGPHLMIEAGRLGESAPHLGGEGFKQSSALLIPLLFAGEALGALVLLRRSEPHTFHEAEVARATTLGDLASVMLRRALLMHAERRSRGEAERRAREERALLNATETLASTYTIEQVIGQIADSALTATGADVALVERIDVERGEVAIAAIAGEPPIHPGVRATLAGSLTEQVVEKRETTFLPDLAGARGRISAALLRRCPDHSALAVPLLNAGEAVGALFLLRKPDRCAFLPDEAERARTFARLAALAFRRVHLLADSERKRADFERATASRARLMHGFSHDVKNPLGAADGHLQLLLMQDAPDRLTPKQQRSVAKARRSLGAALRLIEDLLTLAQAEADVITVEWTAVSMRDAAREVAEEYRAQAEGKGLAYRVETSDEIPVIRSDPDRARQILGNLISNAIKYTHGGGVTVRVGLRSDGGRAGRGGWVVVDVADTGAGIAEEHQAHLFQEFRRLDETAGDVGGAGLGLAISQTIASALGGKITVESVVGRGSTFTLWLPRERDASQEEAPRSRAR